MEEFSRFNLFLNMLRDSLVEIAYSFAAQWDNSMVSLSVDAPTPFSSSEADNSSNSLSRRGWEDNRTTGTSHKVIYLQIMKILLGIIFQIMKILPKIII